MTWKTTSPAPDNTHHVRGSNPLYAERFDQVLAFHEPGLAPVRQGNEAWHICLDGKAAYQRRFQRTFGFYQGLAAVESSDGWHHIRPDGANAYVSRFDWCGNFQCGHCAVREHSGRYFHVTPEGQPAYPARWRYAGDYRDGIAVVQADDGRSTHINTLGVLAHGVWFLDLDVFHKGYARARDEEGWTHVDARGCPGYARRFAAVEPFYNGQARVERFDGGLEVIDEAGQTIVELRPPLLSAFASVSRDLVGFWRTQAICAGVELGVFDALPRSAEDLACLLGLDAVRVRRLLLAFAELRLTIKVGEEWRTTERGEYLRVAHPLTLAGAAVEYGRYLSRLWEWLPSAMRADSEWRAPDIFSDVATDPRRSTIHHRMLASYALHDYEAVPAALGLCGDERVIDAGGGLGVLASLLVKTHPSLRVTVLDRPEVIEQAMRQERQHLLEFRSVNLFQPWDAEGDAVVMARVLHDWDDPQALRLLSQARGALSSGGRLFVVEMLVPEGGVAGSLCDLHLLMATGGRERTAKEYEALLEEAGFSFAGIRRIAALPSIIMGVAR
ncbi:MAG: methyltransferase [Candidatus Delongbacteria bacterium]